MRSRERGVGLNCGVGLPRNGTMSLPSSARKSYEKVLDREVTALMHKTLLGHEPESCNGDMTTLTHLFTEEFLHLQVPLLIAAFEEGSLIDGFTDNVKLVNAAGQTMKFEYRMSLSPTDPRKALLIFRLKANAVGPSPMRR